MASQQTIPSSNQSGLLLTADPNASTTDVNQFKYVQYYDATTGSIVTASSILAPDELIAVSSASKPFRLKLTPYGGSPQCQSATATVTFWQVDGDGMPLLQATPKHPFVTPDTEWVGDPTTGKTSVNISITNQDADTRSIYYDFSWAALQGSPHFQYQIQAKITFSDNSSKTYITDPEMDDSTNP